MLYIDYFLFYHTLLPHALSLSLSLHKHTQTSIEKESRQHIEPLLSRPGRLMSECRVSGVGGEEDQKEGVNRVREDVVACIPQVNLLGTVLGGIHVCVCVCVYLRQQQKMKCFPHYCNCCSPPFSSFFFFF